MKMKILVNNTGKEHLYENVYSSLVQDIISGKRKTGEKLPSIRNSASDLGLSKNTIEAAYYQLMEEGYIESKAKSGFFVCRLTQFHHSRWEKQHKDRKTVPKEEPQKDETQQVQFIELQANCIDEGLFPYTLLRKLYRETVSGNKAGLFLKNGDPQGDIEFRQSLSKYLGWSRRVICDEGQIVIGAGTEYLLQMAIKILHAYSREIQGTDALKNKIHFFLEKPGYEKPRTIVKDEGCSYSFIPLDSEGLIVNSLKQDSNTDISKCENISLSKESPTIQAVYTTPAHQFPLGMTMSYARRIELLKWAKESSSHFIIEDDYDSDFYYSGRILPSLHSIDDDGNVLYMGTFSRSLAPSMRVSYLVLSKKLLEVYKSFFSQYSCTVSRIEQNVLTQFINQGHFERHINRTRKIYRQRRDKIITLFKKCVPVHIRGEHAGLHFIAEIQTNIDRVVFEQKALCAGLKIKTLENNGNTKNLLCIIGYAHLSDKEIEDAVSIIASIVKN